MSDQLSLFDMGAFDFTRRAEQKPTAKEFWAVVEMERRDGTARVQTPRYTTWMPGNAERAYSAHFGHDTMETLVEIEWVTRAGPVITLTELGRSAAKQFKAWGYAL